MHVYVGTITHKYGVNTYAGTTEALVLRQIADYCREWWDDVVPPEPVPESDEDCINIYFDNNDEWYSGPQITRVEASEFGLREADDDA